MLYVEPAGGSPDMFNRGFKYLFFAQQATADKQGTLFADWVKSLPEAERPKTAAYPTLDDPFARPIVEGIQRDARGRRHQDGLLVRPTRSTPRTSTRIVNAMKNKNPDLVVHGAVVRGRRRPDPVVLKAGFTPKMLFQTTAPSLRRPVLRGRSARRTPRACSTP